MQGLCAKNPRSNQHCPCVTGERCCWCDTATPAHGPYRDQLPFEGLRQYAERSLKENRCKCGAPGGALHGCTSIETARARVQMEEFWKGDGWTPTGSAQ